MNYTELVGVKKQLITVPLRKPHKHDWFRVHPNPDWSYPASVLKTSGDKRDELYVVSPHLLPLVGNETVPMMFVPTITTLGVFCLCPVRLPGPEGRLDDWGRSAMMAMEQAKSKWTRLVANRALNAYDVLEPVGVFPEPTWPDLPIDEILQIALRDHVIEDIGHPVLRTLRGEV
jgi:hypothetical protein